MLSRVLRSSALLKEPRRAFHELNAIGLNAKVANILGVNPMFFVNTSRAGFESAGTCSGFGTAILGIVVFLTDFDEYLDEVQHIGQRTARLLRPVSRTFRPHGQQQDRYFVVGQPEL